MTLVEPIRSRLTFQVLPPEDLRAIHAAALTTLEETGTAVHCPAGLEILRKAGCRVDDRQRAFIPAGLVEESLAAAPKGVSIYDREGLREYRLEGNNTYFGPTGLSAPVIWDPVTDERRPMTRADARDGARLVDALEHLHFMMTNGMVADVSPHVADLHEFACTAANTTKPIVLINHNRRNLGISIEIAEIIAGGREVLRARPFIIPFHEPLTPLLHSEEAVEKLIFTVEQGLPVIYSPCHQAGATSPVTLAGVIAMAAAEILTGLVIAQQIRPGAPFIMGGSLTIFDMATCVMAYGAPEKDLLLAAYTQLAHHYGLPMFGLGGITDAKVVDEQAAVESAISCIVSALSGTNMVHNPGYVEGSMCGSCEQAVLTNEAIGMAKRIVEGFAVNEETLATRVMQQVGPGGEFLTSAHTLKHFRQEHWRPQIFDRHPFDTWVAKGRKTTRDRIKERIRTILAQHRPTPLPAEVQKRVDARIQEAEREILA